MEKSTKEEYVCPNCKETTRQMNNGFTVAGSQRVRCWHCKKRYTPNPKKWAYSEEERKLALKILASGSTGRGVGKVMNMAKSNVYRWTKEAAKKGL